MDEENQEELGLSRTCTTRDEAKELKAPATVNSREAGRDLIEGDYAGRDTRKAGRDFTEVTNHYYETSRKTKLDRRSFLWGASAVIAGTYLNGDRWLWDEYDSRKGALPEELEHVSRIFHNWSKADLIWGNDHPIYRTHPDVIQAGDKIIDEMNLSEVTSYLKYDKLSSPTNGKTTILVGGPYSNRFSASWRGFNNGRRPNKRTGILSSLRWEFDYSDTGQPNRKRFVNNDLISSSPKRIVDFKTGLYLDIKVDDEQMIASDYLLLTHVKTSGTTYVDVADLHGQGNKMFSFVLGSRNMREELISRLNRAHNSYFQALYEIKVLHDRKSKVTIAKNARLIGFESIV